MGGSEIDADADSAAEEERPELTRELLVRRYHDRGQSTAEIAEATGWSKAQIWKRLQALDIETRAQQQSQFHDLDDELLQYLDWLTPQQREDLKAVAVEGRGITEQARRRGVEPGSVRRTLRRGVDRLESIVAERSQE
ncbi:hypothetical protein [Halorhabdus utahensis]|nr:hypothetical protein [Halorhabdus utahensis]